MCECVWHTYAMRVHIHVCVCKPEVNIEYFPIMSSALFLKAGFLTRPGIHQFDLNGWPQSPRIPLPPSPQCWDSDTHRCTDFLMWLLVPRAYVRSTLLSEPWSNILDITLVFVYSCKSVCPRKQSLIQANFFFCWSNSSQLWATMFICQMCNHGSIAQAPVCRCSPNPKLPRFQLVFIPRDS